MLATRPISIAGAMESKPEPPEPFLSSPSRLAEYASGVNLMAFLRQVSVILCTIGNRKEAEVFKTGSILVLVQSLLVPFDIPKFGLPLQAMRLETLHNSL
jgi:hypothetical protein